MKKSPPSAATVSAAPKRKPAVPLPRARSRRSDLRRGLRAVAWVAVVVGLALGLYLTFCDREPIARLVDMFDEDVRSSDRVTLDSWRKRGLWRKAQEAVASVLQDQV